MRSRRKFWPTQSASPWFLTWLKADSYLAATMAVALPPAARVMVFLGDAGAKQLLSSQFKLGAEAGIAAGPLGREAQASTDWKLKDKILVYSRTKGLFAGIDLSGASVKQDDDSTRAYYGNVVPFEQVLNGQGPKNANSGLFLTDVREAFHESNARK